MLTLAEIKKRIKPFEGSMERTKPPFSKYVMRWEWDG